MYTLHIIDKLSFYCILEQFNRLVVYNTAEPFFLCHLFHVLWRDVVPSEVDVTVDVPHATVGHSRGDVVCRSEMDKMFQ